MKRFCNIFFICLYCISVAIFVASCENPETPTFSFEHEDVSLTKGDCFDLSDNHISIGEIINYSCSNDCVQIQGNNILAKDCGEAIITAEIEYKKKTYSHSFSITVEDYSKSFYFIENTTKISSLSLAVGYDYVIGLHNDDADTEVEYSLSNNKATFNSTTKTLSPNECGTCTLYAKLYKNNIHLKTASISINIEQPLAELSVSATNMAKVSASSFYASTTNSGFFKINNINQNNISNLAYQSEDIDIDINNTVFENGYVLIPFETQSFGNLTYSFSYENDFKNLNNTKYGSGAIRCYQLAAGINFEASVTSNLDESYSLLLAHGTSAQKSQAITDGYTTSIPFVLSTTNTNTNCTFDIDISNDNISIIDNVIYPVAVGSSIITITAQDGSNVSIQIVIKIVEPLPQDIVSTYEETTTVYLANNGVYTICLNDFCVNPAYCIQDTTFMFDGEMYDTDIDIYEVGEYSLVVTAGEFEKTYTFNVRMRPDSIMLYEANVTTTNNISFRFNYGGSTFLSNDITIKHFVNNEWVVVPTSDAIIEGSTISLASYITMVRVCWSVDESIFTDYTF